jgi:predicted nucleic acid-binding protein
MQLYLDVSFLKRPFDDLSIQTNRIEADLLFVILREVALQRITLIHSALIEYENSKNTHERRRAFTSYILRSATTFQSVTPKIRDRAIHLGRTCRIASIDALHIASAEAADADFFVTCDHALIKRYADDIVVVSSPVAFIHAYGDHSQT